ETVAPVQAEFVVGDEHHDLVIFLETEPQASLGVVQGQGFDGHVIQDQGAPGGLIDKTYVSLQLLKGHGEKTVPHVVVKDPFQGLKGQGPAVHLDFRVLPVYGEKKRQADQMIPVVVGQEQVHADGGHRGSQVL